MLFRSQCSRIPATLPMPGCFPRSLPVPVRPLQTLSGRFPAQPVHTARAIECRCPAKQLLSVFRICTFRIFSTLLPSDRLSGPVNHSIGSFRFQPPSNLIQHTISSAGPPWQFLPAARNPIFVSAHPRLSISLQACPASPAHARRRQAACSFRSVLGAMANRV